MSLLPSSPRAQRRVAWLAGSLLALLAAGVALASLPGAKRQPKETLAPAPAVAVPAAVEEREIALTPAMRRGINATLDRFIPAAVLRRDPALAWKLAGPGLRGGTTRADWVAGELPVFPFPARERAYHDWEPLFAYPSRVAFDLLLHPRKGARVGAIAVSVDMVRSGRAWLVDAWYPTAVFNSPDERMWVTGMVDFTADGGTAEAYYERPKFHQGRLSATWLVVPIVLLGAGIVLVPLALAFASARRSRRAAAAYAARAGSRGA